MYCIANLASRTVLTNKRGDVIFNITPALAHNMAIHAQQETNEPHTVLAWETIAGAIPWNHPATLRRSVAPWLQR